MTVMGYSRVSNKWADSGRSQRLPPDWPARRAKVLKRDGRICWLCGGAGADAVDHKVRGDDHSDANLAAVHQDVWPYCHRKKNASEGHAARWRHRMARSPERHPGLL